MCLEKKQELCADDDVNAVPDVKAAIQEIMMNVFISTYNHMDEDGRCYSDSFQDMPVIPVDEADEKETDNLRRYVVLTVRMMLNVGHTRMLQDFL